MFFKNPVLDTTDGIMFLHLHCECFPKTVLYMNLLINLLLFLLPTVKGYIQYKNYAKLINHKSCFNVAQHRRIYFVKKKKIEIYSNKITPSLNWQVVRGKKLARSRMIGSGTVASLV
jgi:hypothetical protein